MPLGNPDSKGNFGVRVNAGPDSLRDRAVGTTGNPAVATLSGAAGKIIEGVQAHWSYSDAPLSGKLTLKDGDTVIDEVDIISGGPGFLPLTGYKSSVGNSLSATLAGASGVIGKVSIVGAYL